MARLSVTTILVLSIVGCASPKSVKDDLSEHIGKPIKEVTEVMGRPSGVYNMQDGTYEYIWRGEGVGTTGTGFGIGGVTVLQQSPRECRKVLVTNEQRIVIDVKVEGKCKR